MRNLIKEHNSSSIFFELQKTLLWNNFRLSKMIILYKYVINYVDNLNRVPEEHKVCRACSWVDESKC